MDKDLTILQEFGLSKNEAKAYLTLIYNGPQSGSDLAYKSNIPRAKIYSVSKRLVKKGLAILISNKPLILDAIPPQDVFNKFVDYYETLANNARNTIKVLDEIRLNKAVAIDKMYHVRGMQTVSNAIANSRSSILLMINRQCIDLFDKWKDDIINALNDGINVKMLTDIEFSIPYIQVKRYNPTNNMLIIDEKSLILIDVINNKCYLFNDKEFVSMHTQAFYYQWDQCLVIV